MRIRWAARVWEKLVRRGNPKLWKSRKNAERGLLECNGLVRIRWAARIWKKKKEESIEGAVRMQWAHAH